MDFQPPISAIQKSVTVFSKNPIVLVPALAGAIISSILSFIDRIDFFGVFWFADLSFYSTNQILLGLVVSLIAASQSLFLTLVSLHMVKDAFQDVKPDIMKSLSYVRGRLITLVIAAIIAQVLVLTLFLIPLAIAMIVILYIDETSVGTALTRALEFLRKRPVDLIILAGIALVARAILGPLISVPFVFILSIVTDLMVVFAVMEIYSSYKKSITGSVESPSQE